jgi:hypothetical protein
MRGMERGFTLGYFTYFDARTCFGAYGNHIPVDPRYLFALTDLPPCFDIISSLGRPRGEEGNGNLDHRRLNQYYTDEIHWSMHIHDVV